MGVLLVQRNADDGSALPPRLPAIAKALVFPAPKPATKALQTTPGKAQSVAKAINPPWRAPPVPTWKAPPVPYPGTPAAIHHRLDAEELTGTPAVAKTPQQKAPPLKGPPPPKKPAPPLPKWTPSEATLRTIKELGFENKPPPPAPPKPMPVKASGPPLPLEPPTAAQRERGRVRQLEEMESSTWVIANAGPELPEAKRARTCSPAKAAVEEYYIGDSPTSLSPPPAMDASAKAQQSGRSHARADLQSLSAALRSVGPDRSEKHVLCRKVRHDYECKERQALLDEALKREAAGVLSQEDVFLINWIVVGDCQCFNEKGRYWCEEPRARFEEVYKCLKDPDLAAQLAAAPVHRYLCTVLNETLEIEEERAVKYREGAPEWMDSS